MCIYLLVSHDVDWSRRGPSIEHILARRDRFSEEVIRRVLEEGFNPYFGVPDLMEFEERVGVRSTFFFRPWYDDGCGVELYEDVIKDLIRGGWEVGLHVNDASSVGSVRREKEVLERVAGVGVVGCRVHYLRISVDRLHVLRDAGFLYDSSIVFSRDRVDLRNTGFIVVDGLVEFPITFMDAYLFTYMGLSEEEVIPFIDRALNMFAERGVEIVTLLWHDNSIRMRGGRIYPKLLEHLASREDVILVKGIDAYRIVEERMRKGEA